MIYIIIAAIIIFIILAFLIFYYYKADNTMIEFTKKINDSYEQINSEMHKRAETVKTLIEHIMPSIIENTDLDLTVQNLKKAMDSYFIAGTRDYQIKAQNEITKHINELIILLDKSYNELIDNNIRSLVEEIKKSEEKINFSKNIFNSLVQNYNAYISKFLNKRVAKTFKYTPMKKLGEENEKL